VRHRDVCEFGFNEELNGIADAVFLDLPAPWLAIPHAVKSLKQSGKNIYFHNFIYYYLIFNIYY